MSVGIVIPFYKKSEQLKKCNEALSKQTYKDIETFIHDNSENNLGFTKAVNIGLRKYLNKTYTIVLNQDCYLKPDAIEKMVKFMDEHTNCAIGGIKQISVNNPDFILHGGCTMAFPQGRHIIGSQGRKDCSVSLKMPWVNGAVLIVRNSLIPEFGLMDENFFLIGSDSDWCYAARQRGCEVWYIAEAECSHEDDGISKVSSDLALTARMRLDMVYFADKWITDGCFRELSLEVF